MAKVTPARKQYLDIKSQYPDCILFFRMGDFYEMFDTDAEIAARELDITLTARKSSPGTTPIPMAGVPYHAVDGYIARLIEKGYHVAVCDQTSRANGKGIVKREVTRVVTPGTVFEPSLLTDDKPNYLMAILPVGKPEQGDWTQAGIAYVDISTGVFATTQLQGQSVGVLVLEELARLDPREVIMPESWVEQGITLPQGIHLTPVQDWTFEFAGASQLLKDHFRVQTLDGYGLHGQDIAIATAGGVLQYLRQTQKNSLSQLTQIRWYSTDSFMVLDQFTRRNLEITQTIRSGKTKGSLLGVIDKTKTAMGARLLRTWMNQPLLDLNRLNARLNAVESLSEDDILRLELQEALVRVSDMERLVNRILMDRANARDLLALRDSLSLVPQLREMVLTQDALVALGERLDPCDDVMEIVTRGISEDAPAIMNTIGTILLGYDQELDQILADSHEAREWIAQLEPHERQRTGIPTIKVGFNKVFGYYIEVTKTHSDKVPEDYIRKQTLVNAERYITPELKEYETLVLNAEESILRREKKVFAQICDDIKSMSETLLRTANALAHLDVFVGLATLAINEGYIRPILTESDELRIVGGRHPVVEKLLSDSTRYVANDTYFDEQSRVHIITGPNMSGKSTYIRQVAVITLLAQIGSFVPADEAEIGLVDRIFARIGAQDEIHAGQSTFMVEMVETARLLSGSSSRSLVILDEIGRGTSTYDGLAIARSVIEYIHNHPRLNCRTLFATHYHELTTLPDILPRTENYNVSVAEHGEDIVFLHRVVHGGADQSYGIHVAQIAGMPRPVVDRARELLAHLENEGSDFTLPKTSNTQQNSDEQSDVPQQLNMFDVEEHVIVSMLRELDVNIMSPIEAMTKLFELKRILEEE